MNQKEPDHLIESLVSILEALIERQGALHGVVRAKLDAMRRADTEQMMQLSHREGGIASEINELEKRRGDHAASLASAMMPPLPGGDPSLSLRMLARRLDDEPGARLTRLGETLREKMLQTAEANRVVELVSREMLAHFNNLFSVFTQDENEPRTYSRGGAMEDRTGVKVLDAVG